MPKRPPKLSRGYTKVREWLFDSDDDTMPVPRLPVATSPAVRAHADCISPPPPKRMAFAAAPAKAVPSATRRESVLPKPRPPTTTVLGQCLCSRNRPRACAAEDIAAAPLGCTSPHASKGEYEGHAASRIKWRPLCPPPTHIDRAPPCPRWCSMANCCDQRETKNAMDVLGERYCRSPTDRSSDGGRQALATCHKRGQADN